MLRPRSHGKSRWTRGFRSSWHPHNPSNDAKIAPDFFQRRKMQKCSFLLKSASQYAQRENAHFTKDCSISTKVSPLFTLHKLTKIWIL